MKKSAFLFLLVSVFAISSCKKENTNKEHFVYLDMQYGFDNDQLSIYIDGEEKFNSSVTSNPSLGFAFAISSLQKEGLHTVKAVMNGDRTATTALVLKSNLYVGVAYTGEGKLKIITQDEPFIYD